MRSERQRRSGTEPKVGAQRLPWVEGTNEMSTPLGFPSFVFARQPNVVPQSRDNVGLWGGAPLGLRNVQTQGTGVPPVRIVQSTRARRPCHYRLNTKGASGPLARNSYREEFLNSSCICASSSNCVFNQSVRPSQAYSLWLRGRFLNFTLAKIPGASSNSKT